MAKSGAVVLIAHAGAILQDWHKLRILHVQTLKLRIVAFLSSSLKSIRHLSVVEQHIISHHWIGTLVERIVRLVG